MNLGESSIIGEQPFHSEYTRRFSAGCRNLHLQHLHHFRCGAHADPSLGMPSCQSKCRVHYGKSSRIEAVANRQPQIRVPHVPTLGHGFPQGSKSQNRELSAGDSLALQLRRDRIGLCRRIPPDRQHIRLAADLAVFHILLLRSTRLIHRRLDPFEASRTLKPRLMHSVPRPCV